MYQVLKLDHNKIIFLGGRSYNWIDRMAVIHRLPLVKLLEYIVFADLPVFRWLPECILTREVMRSQCYQFAKILNYTNILYSFLLHMTRANPFPNKSAVILRIYGRYVCTEFHFFDPGLKTRMRIFPVFIFAHPTAIVWISFPSQGHF